jgi:uncharacterized OB-fold protein
MAVPNLWRTKEQRYRLQGEVCPACHQTVFPPKPVCPHCHHGAVTPTATTAPGDSSYVMVFHMPQVKELNAVGDD